MPFFQVMLHCQGISVPAEDGSPPIIGFYTTRFVHASSVEGALKTAKQIVIWSPKNGRHEVW
jgi:hypothetical protein